MIDNGNEETITRLIYLQREKTLRKRKWKQLFYGRQGILQLQWRCEEKKERRRITLQGPWTKYVLFVLLLLAASGEVLHYYGVEDMGPSIKDKTNYTFKKNLDETLWNLIYVWTSILKYKWVWNIIWIVKFCRKFWTTPYKQLPVLPPK